MKPEQLPQAFQQNLRYWRKAKSFSIRALGTALGTSDSAIVNWESGKSSPTLTSVVKLSRALGVTPEALLMETLPMDASLPIANAG